MLADVLNRLAEGTGLTEKMAPFRPRPSSAGPERCIRSMVYHALGTPAAPLPGRAIAIFDDSSWHAELVKDWLRKSAFTIHSEEMAVETPAGKGHIDGIITDISGQDRVLELKAVNHFSFERMWGMDFPLDYFAQCVCYIVGVQQVVPSVREAILLVKNKNTAQYLEFRLDYESKTDTLKLVEMVRSTGEVLNPGFEMPRVVFSIVEKFRRVNEYAESNTLPKRPFTYGTTFPCGYCRWAETCWNGYAEELKAMGDAAVLDESCEELAETYKALGRAETAIKKDRDEAKKKLIAALTEKNAAGGVAGKYYVQMQLVQTKEYTAPAKSYLKLNAKEIKK